MHDKNKSLLYILDYYVDVVILQYLKDQFFTISESVAYHWGPKPGLIRYYFLEGSRPNTKSDVLSLGFITPLENAIMFRIDSDSSSDFIEVAPCSVSNYSLSCEL